LPPATLSGNQSVPLSLYLDCSVSGSPSPDSSLPVSAAQAAFQQDKFASQADPDISATPNSYLIKFQANANSQARNQALASVGASQIREFGLVPGLVHIHARGPADRVISALQANPLVEYVEPDFVVRAFETTVSDQYFDLQWGLYNYGQSIRGTTGIAGADIRMLDAWKISKGGEGCWVAVIDSGVQWNHPDLAANIWENPLEAAGSAGIDDDGNGFVDDYIGWDFYANDNNPDDENGHGTHVAGTAAAVSDNSIGVAGVAQDCRIVPVRFLGPNGSGSTSDAIASLNYAVDLGVRVSNNSWGGGSNSTALYQAIKAAGDDGHVFVAAAGNNKNNTDRRAHYPSSYDLANIISVAATDNRDRLASFSNYGAKTVDLGAPGVDIASTYKDNGYAWMSGTSMAAPHVAGVIALLNQKYPQLTVTELVEQILSTTRFVSALNGKTLTGGVLNAYDALTAGFYSETPPPEDSSPPDDEAMPEDPPAEETIPNAPANITATNNGKGSATVNWTDESENESGFHIQREKQNPAGKWTGTTILNADKNQESYTDSPGAGTYRYRVRSFNDAGNSDWTDWASVNITK
jgi:subtilisin family serine protease